MNRTPLAYWRDHIGASTDPQVIAKSPARFASAVRAPILLIHGVDDTVVPISQSQHMARALQAARRPYELIELPGEDHWMMTSSASRIRTSDRARALSLEAHRRRRARHKLTIAHFCGPRLIVLQTRRPTPMYARLTFTGATGFDVGSEP